MDPYALYHDPAGAWLLLEVDTGEIMDEFMDEQLARQTLKEQNEPL